jgi:hypothetical protein
MRLKSVWAAISVAGISLTKISLIGAMVFLAGTPAARAQVAPAAKVGGIPITFGIGGADYNLDYGPGRRMQGPVVWAAVGVFHGLGVDASARTIFMNTPSQLTRMQQSTFLGGVYYEKPHFWIIRPFVRAAEGLGVIEFPSRNPAYTRDSYTVWAPSGGLDFQVSQHVAIRGQYEYQFWKDYHGTHYLTPQGVTLGVSYSLLRRRARPHELN